MLTRCPGCGKQIEETLDICPHCKRDFTKEIVKGSGRRVAPMEPAPAKGKGGPPKGDSELPPHMLADMESPAADTPEDAFRKAESVLPPHMLAGADELATGAKNAPKPIPPALWVAVGAVICAALLAPKFFAKPPPPPEPVAKVTVQEPAPPEDSDDAETIAQAALPADGKGEEGKEKPAAPGDDAAAPPPIDEEPPRKAAKEPKKKRPKQEVLLASAPEAPPEPPPQARSNRPAKWRIKGKVLNLVTLEPVSDADLTFTAANGESKRTSTGSRGDFRISLTPNDSGYDLKISHSEYDSKYLPENGHSGKSEEERKEIAKRLLNAYPKSPPLNPGEQDSLDADFVLLPRPKLGVSMNEALLKSGEAPPR